MATSSSSSSTSSVGFNQGDFNLKLQNWIADPSNANNPLTTILSCLPNSEYTNTEFQNIKVSIDSIILEAGNYESKRVLTEATNIKEQLDIVMCIGEDMTYLFAGFVEHAKYFIEQYNLVKPTLVLTTDVNQNPNYYNN